MTVQCLDEETKKLIIQYYQNTSLNQKQLSDIAKVSPRTIHRVIVEAGLATPVARIQGEAFTVMQLLKKHGVDIPKLKELLKSYQ